MRVGAVLDPGSARVFDGIIAAANRARKSIGRAGAQGSEEFVGGYRTAPAAARKAFGDVDKEAERSAKAAARVADKKAKEEARAAEWVYQIKKRYLDKEEREAERTQRSREKAIRGGISNAAGTFRGLVGRGVGVAGEIARGAGVDFNIGSLVQKHVALEKAATDITASAYVEGASGSVGKRQDPHAVMSAVRAASNTAAVSSDQTMEGLQKFVGKSTDLETGTKVLAKMAVLSKSTGSNMADMMDAAGDVAVKLGDGADKADILYGLMKSVAKQGQVGASEIRTMAPFIGRVMQSAKQFDGSITDAARDLGMVFQITKKEQGLTVGAAATATSRFVDSLKSKGGMKALHSIGLKDEDVFTKSGSLKSLRDIIPKAMELTAGDPRKIAKAFPNVMAARVANAFGGVYRNAEQQKKGSGKAAVLAMMGEYGGEMSEKQINESLARAMSTTESKVQLFNNRMEEIASDTLPRLVPAFEKLAPHVETAANAFANVVAWTAENPGKAILAAIVGSIGKAALGEGISKALSSTNLSVAGAVFFTSAAATIAITDAVISMRQQAEDQGQRKGMEALNTLSQLKGEERTGKVSTGTLSEAEQQAAQLEERIKAAEGKRGLQSPAYNAASGVASFITNGAVGAGTFSQQAQAQSDLEHLATLKADLAALKGEMAKIHSGTLKVEVVNQPAGGGPAPGSTSGPVPVRGPGRHP